MEPYLLTTLGIAKAYGWAHLSDTHTHTHTHTHKEKRRKSCTHAQLVLDDDIHMRATSF